MSDLLSRIHLTATTLLTTLLTTVRARVLATVRPTGRARRTAPEAGQSTVEYALVILAAAAMALLVVAWAARTGRIGELFDRVIDSVSSKVA
jgi:hypothetical protein